MATGIFLEIVQEREFPEFITTYLKLDHTFLASSYNHRPLGKDVSAHGVGSPPHGVPGPTLGTTGGSEM